MDVPDPPKVPGSWEDALAHAKQRRPDLRAAELRADIARLETHSTALNWAPSLRGNFTYLFTENVGFVGLNNWWTVPLEAEWNLWDGGLRLAQVREAASRARMADLNARRQVQISEEEVRTAWQRYQRAEQALEAVAVEVELSEENLKLAQRGFEAGTTTWLEVEQAELGLVMSRLNRISEQMNRDLAAVDLLVATGAY